MKYKLIFIAIVCFACQKEQIPQPIAQPKVQKVYGLQPHPTGSSFYPIFIPILNGK